MHNMFTEGGFTIAGHKTVFGAMEGRNTFAMSSLAKSMKLSYTHAPIPTTSRYFTSNFRIGWDFLFFYQI